MKFINKQTNQYHSLDSDYHRGGMGAAEELPAPIDVSVVCAFFLLLLVSFTMTI